jgi:acetolactate synthase-1/2/3 large subunit
VSAPTTRAPESGDAAPTNGHHTSHPAKSPAPKRVAPQQMTGAEAVVRSLEELGVDLIFGIPGGAVLPVYDPLFDSQQLRHVLVRHEQGAGHAASGYAHATGRVGVMMATSGPGATPSRSSRSPGRSAAA